MARGISVAIIPNEIETKPIRDGHGNLLQASLFAACRIYPSDPGAPLSGREPSGKENASFFLSHIYTPVEDPTRSADRGCRRIEVARSLNRDREWRLPRKTGSP